MVSPSQDWSRPPFSTRPTSRRRPRNGSGRPRGANGSGPFRLNRLAPSNACRTRCVHGDSSAARQTTLRFDQAQQDSLLRRDLTPTPDRRSESPDPSTEAAARADLAENAANLRHLEGEGAAKEVEEGQYGFSEKPLRCSSAWAAIADGANRTPGSRSSSPTLCPAAPRAQTQISPPASMIRSTRTAFG